MKSRKNRASLKHALDLCDRLCLLRQAEPEARPKGLQEGEGEEENAFPLRREILNFLKARPLPGALGKTGRKHRLNPQEMLILLVLLRSRVVEGQCYLNGRDLIGILFDSTFDLLRGTELLNSEARLCKSGAVVANTDGAVGADLLDQEFRLSDSLYEEIYAEIHDRPSVVHEDVPEQKMGYQGNLELLMDLRRLSVHHQKRAGRAFQIDYWQEGEARVEESVETLSREIEKTTESISDKLALTPLASSFPLIKFQDAYQLDEKELIIAVTLLFQEFLYGHSYLEAVELVKLISGDEAELIQNRRILDGDARLVQSEIVIIEHPIADKDFVSEAHLSDWAVDVMIAEPPRKKGMDGTARLKFQRYIHELKDSGDFYKNLRRRRG